MLKRNHRSAIALTALAAAVTSRALLLPAWAGLDRTFLGSDDNHPERVKCYMTGVDGKRLACNSAGMGRTVRGRPDFTFAQISRPGVLVKGLYFETEVGTYLSKRRLEFQVWRVMGGVIPSGYRKLGNGRGRCILDVSDEIYGIVVQSCTFTLTNGQTVSAEATYVNSIKGDSASR